MCKNAGVQYNASIWDPEMIDWVDKFQKFYKIGFRDLTAYPIILEFTKKRKTNIIINWLIKFARSKSDSKLYQKI